MKKTFLILLLALLFSACSTNNKIAESNSKIPTYNNGNLLSALLFMASVNSVAQANDAAICRSNFLKNDFIAAFQACKKEAEKGNPLFQYITGVNYENGQGVTENRNIAYYWYKLAAEQSQSNAQNNLATLYKNGRGVTKDFGRAVFWYKQAAEQNLAEAQFNLAFMYDKGQGVVQNFSQALYWYNLSAAQGYAVAQYNLALIYEGGKSTLQDYNKAFTLFKLAAEQGVIEARYNLAVLYANGQGVLQDDIRAHMWWNTNAADGHEKSIKNRDLIAKRMTTKQIAESLSLKKECSISNFKICN